MTPEEILKSLQDKLGDDDFFSPSHLVKTGVFQSASAIRDALKRRIFPFVKITSKRFLIPRQAVLEYLKKNIVDSNQSAGYKKSTGRLSKLKKKD